MLYALTMTVSRNIEPTLPWLLPNSSILVGGLDGMAIPTLFRGETSRKPNECTQAWPGSKVESPNPRGTFVYFLR